MNEAKEVHRVDSTAVRAAATLLIVNSHLEALYPRRWMAGDGLLGNTIFFFVAGLSAALSSQRSETGFFTWYGRRIARIYPPLLISSVLAWMILQEPRFEFSVTAMVRELVWPTHFEFIKWILIYYVAGYAVMRLGRAAQNLAFAGALAAAIFMYWQVVSQLPTGGTLAMGSLSPAFWNWAFFVVFLGGTLMPRANAATVTEARGWLAFAALAFAAYIAWKFQQVGATASAWFGALNVLALLIAASATRAASVLLPADRLRSIPIVGPFTLMLSAMTLELYICHEYVSRHPTLVALAWPVNLAVVYVLAVLISWAVWRISRPVHEAILRRLESRTLSPGSTNA